MSRSYNFSAGPSVIAEPALERARRDIFDLGGCGMGPMELSHRGKEFDAVHDEAIALVRELLSLPEDFRVLYLQGGASLQFAMVPMHFLGGGASADYVLTGSWAQKAYKEAGFFGEVRVAATSEETNFDRIPPCGPETFDPKSKYVHITSNNTIFGTQFPSFPKTGGAPLVVDMSSDIMSRPVDFDGVGLIYAGAQKNLGPAGLTLVLVRQSFLDAMNHKQAAILSYKKHLDADSRYNTPPTFGVYMLRNVLAWIKEEGGLTAMAERNESKAKLLYDAIDNSGGYYTGHAQKESRSLMNVPFRLPSEELEKKFLAEAAAKGLKQLAGHRSVGGLRASIYNAMPREGVQALCDFMAAFKKANG